MSKNLAAERSGSDQFLLEPDHAPLRCALFFETIEEIYLRIFQHLTPRAAEPKVTVHFRKYANANSRIRLENGCLTVHIADILQEAPAPVHEALASILLSKLFRKPTSTHAMARYRRYLNRSDVRTKLESLKRNRGRKAVLNPAGGYYNLCEIFEALNLQYFFGLMARPNLGWSLRPSRTTLGHYDPSHNTIVLSNLLDSPLAPRLIVNYVMFHEMLHLKFPTEQRARRRCVHTREFKLAEAQFENFEEAKRELSRFLDALFETG